MAMKVKVKIENLDQTIEAEVGQDLRRVLLDNDVKLYRGWHNWPLVGNCRGHAMCGRCVIEVVDGNGLTDKSLYEKLRVPGNQRLACQTRVYQDCTIKTLAEPYEVEAEARAQA